MISNQNHCLSFILQKSLKLVNNVICRYRVFRKFLMGQRLNFNNNDPPVRLGQAIGALLNVKPLDLVLF